MTAAAKAVVFGRPAASRHRPIPLAADPATATCSCERSGRASAPAPRLLAYRGEIDPSLALDETIGTLSRHLRVPVPLRLQLRRPGEWARPGIPDGRIVFAFHAHQDASSPRRQTSSSLGEVDPRVATLFPLVETALQVALDAGPVLEEAVVVIGLGSWAS